ncbi:MAG: hypothetical protein U0230_10790 [Polyangiales bacterium]
MRTLACFLALLALAAAPDVGYRDAVELLHPTADPERSRDALECQTRGDEAARIRCLVERRYSVDAEARALALSLFDRTGSIAGLEVEQDFDGGYRGMLHLVPVLPVARERRHLAWITSATFAIDGFLDEVRRRAPESVRYRATPLVFRFFRSVRRTTPSAYASGWTVAYNVAGSLHRSETAVRDTLFHEVFHLNDAAHGGWSEGALEPLVASIRRRCGTNSRCLAPYAPNATKVRGGTYYAFQPGNDVREYAAELAIRYFHEQEAAMRGSALRAPPFRCGSRENREAYDALSAEFFGGLDLLPRCTHEP